MKDSLEGSYKKKQKVPTSQRKRLLVVVGCFVMVLVVAVCGFTFFALRYPISREPLVDVRVPAPTTGTEIGMDAPDPIERSRYVPDGDGGLNIDATAYIGGTIAIVTVSNYSDAGDTYVVSLLSGEEVVGKTRELEVGPLESVRVVVVSSNSNVTHAQLEGSLLGVVGRQAFSRL